MYGIFLDTLDMQKYNIPIEDGNETIKNQSINDGRIAWHSKFSCDK